MSASVPQISSIGANVVSQIIKQDRARICEIVKDAYIAFGNNRAINPHSVLLSFDAADPGSRNRIIALPACIYDNINVAGIKWIASFPDNTTRNLPRASAVLLLNDVQTGFPFACMEGSIISAARTAASAMLGADLICAGSRAVPRVGFVGTGLIGDMILDFFAALNWKFGEIYLFDKIPDNAATFRAKVESRHNARVVITQTVEELISKVDLIVFATTAAAPYIQDIKLFKKHPRVLNISLRDLGPDIILSADNVVDDTDHCLRANTSLHLAERQVDSRDFVSANIYDCLSCNNSGSWKPRKDRTAIFSPFGMGILDLAVGMHIYRESEKQGTHTPIENFFPLGAAC